MAVHDERRCRGCILCTGCNGHTCLNPGQRWSPLCGDCGGSGHERCADCREVDAVTFVGTRAVCAACAALSAPLARASAPPPVDVATPRGA